MLDAHLRLRARRDELTSADHARLFELAKGMVGERPRRHGVVAWCWRLVHVAEDLADAAIADNHDHCPLCREKETAT